jgi:hypothetical protein
MGQISRGVNNFFLVILIFYQNLNIINSSFIELIINQTLKLFCALSDQKLGNYMTPLHYIALIDMQSNWFVKWMHGHDSRKVLIESIKKNELFVIFLVFFLISLTS